MFPLNYLFTFQMDLVITGNEAQNQIMVGVESKDMDHHRSHREPGPITRAIKHLTCQAKTQRP